MISIGAMFLNSLDVNSNLARVWLNCAIPRRVISAEGHIRKEEDVPQVNDCYTEMTGP